MLIYNNAYLIMYISKLNKNVASHHKFIGTIVNTFGYLCEEKKNKNSEKVINFETIKYISKLTYYTRII